MLPWSVHASLITISWQTFQHASINPDQQSFLKALLHSWSIGEREFQHKFYTCNGTRYVQCVIIIGKKTKIFDLCDTAHTVSRFNVPSTGPDGSVCISGIASDVRSLWLPMKISQMLVCKQQSHQKLKIVLELDEIHFCCGKLHACNSLFVFLKPDKIL